ncbi:MAG: NB-ARC domain-containing protein [Cyanobacteriota bacterium]|nr:NB-ARC domain-containing protein [Cyanobacteriota bacterium]
MDIQDAIKWTDDLVFAKTGQHLDSLQKAVLKGTWQGKKYPEIGKTCNRTHHRIKQVARELWQLMSQELGEDVKQSNFRSILELTAFSYISNLGSDSVQIVGEVNFCREHYPHSKATKNRSPSTQKPEKRHDLTSAPKYNSPYNRTQELNTLKQWILEENSPIVTIIGLSGIGKTALARQLVEEIKDNFHRVLWRSHRQFPTLNSLKTNLKEFLHEPQKTKSQSLINSLNSHRCLIVLDDFQETLTSGELAGTYLLEYENYGKFLKEIGHSSHKSCFLLLSWEKPTEIATLETENCNCHTLQLKSLGSAATEIFKAQKLTDENRWLELSDRYSGNPLWLKIIASTIQDLFNGSVAQFLAYPSLFLGDVEPILKEHYRRLSKEEKLVMLWLATQDAAADISSKPPDFVSDSDFLAAIQSLRKRGLIEKTTEEGSSCFTLQPVIKEYAKISSNIDL